MALLDGDIAKQIYQGFKGKLSKGKLRKITREGGLDDNGDPYAEVPVYYSVEGFVDMYTEFYMKENGVPDTDLKVCVFGQSIPGIDIGKDDKIRMKYLGRQQWFQVRKPRIDPAGALWECQAFKIEAPIDGS